MMRGGKAGGGGHGVVVDAGHPPDGKGLRGASRMRAWVMAARPRTLPAAASPVLVGTALAHVAGVLAPLPALAALAGALLLQIAANLANDYYDHVKGADADDRVGPARVTQSGLLAPATVRNAAFLTFAVAILVGGYLVLVGGLPILVIGVAAVLAGYAYTGGPYPLGYHGLGDVFVLAFFGPIAVAGTYYVQALQWSATAVAVGFAAGALATAILVVNNVRDVDTDRRAGKNTLVVRFGAPSGRRAYAVLLALAYAIVIALVATGGLPLGALAVAIATPWALALSRRLQAAREGHEHNAILAATAAHLALFSILLTAGLIAWPS